MNDTPLATTRTRERARHPLREIVRASAENRPGIYRFTGPRAEVLYVGTSVRVRSRLLSYFRDDAPPKVLELLRVAERVEWEYAPNAFEALLRELRQIRAFRPRFNRRHRVERRFAWVRLTAEPAPRLVASRIPARPGETAFGPFPAHAGLPTLLRELSVASGIRDCAANVPMWFADQTDLFSASREPGCARVALGTCQGPCAGLCTTREYEARVRRVRAFLGGTDDSVLHELELRMEEAVARDEYEQAARFRDRCARFRELRDEVVRFQEFLAGLSFVYRVPSTPSGDDRGYAIVEGRVVASFSFEPQPPEEVVLAVRDARAKLPPAQAALEGTAREEIFLVARWFRWRPEEKARTIPLESFESGQWKPASRDVYP